MVSQPATDPCTTTGASSWVAGGWLSVSGETENHQNSPKYDKISPDSARSCKILPRFNLNSLDSARFLPNHVEKSLVNLTRFGVYHAGNHLISWTCGRKSGKNSRSWWSLDESSFTGFGRGDLKPTFRRQAFDVETWVQKANRVVLGRGWAGGRVSWTTLILWLSEANNAFDKLDLLFYIIKFIIL